MRLLTIVTNFSLVYVDRSSLREGSRLLSIVRKERYATSRRAHQSASPLQSSALALLSYLRF